MPDRSGDVDLPSSLGWQRAPQTYAYYVDSNYGVESPYPHNSQNYAKTWSTWWIVGSISPAMIMTVTDSWMLS